MISDLQIQALEKDTAMYLDWLKSFEFSPETVVVPEYPVWPRYHDNFHYPMGMKKLLSLGFTGVRDAALCRANELIGNQKKYLLLIHQVYNELDKITEQFLPAAPSSLSEACILYWFAALFRIGTSTIGRIDQHLYPFYVADLQNKIDPEKARSIIAELLNKFEKRGEGKGDTLQNITLSGRDGAGQDQTNTLTYLILELCRGNKYLEPKVNVRIHKNSPPHLLELVADIQLKGTGNCTLFNDDIIIEGLKQYGRPAEIAADYCADGCSEIILDGYGETQFRYIDCVKAVEHVLFNGEENVPQKARLQYYSSNQESIDVHSPVTKGLKSGDFRRMDTFDTFYNAYLEQIKYQIGIILKEPYNSERYPMRALTAATLPDVLEKAIEPYDNPACYHTQGLFIGSLGTAVNSLAAIKSLVYEKKLIGREELLEALKNNFDGQPLVRQLCEAAPKFGNDDNYVDQLAVEIAGKFAAWVTEYDNRVLPGLYNHLFHHTAYSVGATPDGRRYGEPVGEHLSPTPGTVCAGPTAIINSICKINTQEQMFGSTLHLSLPKGIFYGVNDPKKILTGLSLAFCVGGGAVLNLSVLDSAVLHDAQRHPEKHADLIVRVWGFSYHFTRLSREMQNHVIARFEIK